MSNSNRNYTEEQREKLLSLYAEMQNPGIEKISEILQKPVKSIISKLVREGVYVATPKPSSKRTTVSKKELLNELEEILGFDTTGFNNSTKESLTQLIDYLKKST
jgi:predicted peroxiredoxin